MNLLQPFDCPYFDCFKKGTVESAYALDLLFPSTVASLFVNHSINRLACLLGKFLPVR